MARTSSLTLEEQRKVKEELWNGARTAEVASTFNLTMASISAIKAGRMWPSIPWPDGSTGGIPEERRKSLDSGDRFSSSLKKSAGLAKRDKDIHLKVGLASIPGAYERALENARALGFETVHDLHAATVDDLRRTRNRHTELMRKDATKGAAPPDPFDIEVNPGSLPSWEDTLNRYGHLKIVVKAEEMHDEIFQQCISTVIQSLPTGHEPNEEQLTIAAGKLYRRIKLNASRTSS